MEEIISEPTDPALLNYFNILCMNVHVQVFAGVFMHMHIHVCVHIQT